jgi:hypothetical protein
MFPLRVQTIENVAQIKFILIESWREYSRQKLICEVLGLGAKAKVLYFDRDDNNISSYIEITTDEHFRIFAKKSKKFGDSYGAFKGEPARTWNVWLVIRTDLAKPFTFKKDNFICQQCLNLIKGILLKYICVKFISQQYMLQK